MILNVSVRNYTDHLKRIQVQVTTLAHYSEQDFPLKEQLWSAVSKFVFAQHISVP